MAKKPLSKNVASILAWKIKDEVDKTLAPQADALQKKANASKEFKEYAKMYKQREELDKKIEVINKEIEKKFCTKHIKTYISQSYDRSLISLVSRVESYSCHRIMDELLVEDYCSDGNVSSEDLVKNMVDKLLK